MLYRMDWCAHHTIHLQAARIPSTFHINNIDFYINHYCFSRFVVADFQIFRPTKIHSEKVNLLCVRHFQWNRWKWWAGGEEGRLMWSAFFLLFCNLFSIAKVQLCGAHLIVIFQWRTPWCTRTRSHFWTPLRVNKKYKFVEKKHIFDTFFHW